MTAAPGGIPCVMLAETDKIDWMWHAFVLFTVDYADFCERYFGFFIHHIPTDDGSEVTADTATVRAMLRRQFALVCDVLGEKTLKEWYDDCRYASPD
jgi:hypothetical protein